MDFRQHNVNRHILQYRLKGLSSYKFYRNLISWNEMRYSLNLKIMLNLSRYESINIEIIQWIDLKNIHCGFINITTWQGNPESNKNALSFRMGLVNISLYKSFSRSSSDNYTHTKLIFYSLHIVVSKRRNVIWPVF